jgi:hypothetical protein
VTVSGEDYRTAEPDTLRRFAGELISAWNNDRAEDIYRIVAAHLGVALVDVSARSLREGGRGRRTGLGCVRRVSSPYCTAAGAAASATAAAAAAA